MPSKVSSRNIAEKFSKEFNKIINYGPYKRIKAILLSEEHISQRLPFTDDVTKNDNNMLTEERKIILFLKINLKINAIRL